MHESLNASGRKVLIIGASGFVGRHMFGLLGPERAIGTYHDEPVDGGLLFDVRHAGLADVIEDPAAISHAFVLFGDTHPDSCMKRPENSRAVNVVGTKRVVDQLNAWGIPLTFTSSESVFDGRRGNYTEDDAPNPIMLYGQQKLDLEKHLAAIGGGYTVMRLGKVYGATPFADKLFSGWIKAMAASETIRCAGDQVFSPIHVSDVVAGLLLAAEKRATGLFHLCGTKAFSRIELLRMTVAEVEKHIPVTSEIIECSIDDFDLLEPRPKNVSMIPAKVVKATGLAIKPIEPICRDMVDGYFADSRAGLAGTAAR
jgi:dTDP-4-dehydrorhamnose reductase